MATLTWLGHSAFMLNSDNGKRIYVDPFLTGNPKTPDDEKQPDRVDIIAVTHGHSDHVGDTVALSQAFPEAAIVCQVELKSWLGREGANIGPMPGLNKGGSREIDGIRFTLVNAFHSSSSNDGEYLGEACGIVVRLESGITVYFAGDTCLFGDMQLIRHPARAGLRGAPDRRLLHDGAARGGDRARHARKPALHPLPLGHVPAADRDARAAAVRGAERDVLDVQPGDTIELE